MPQTTPHRIVIVGGGAGGLELATRLGAMEGLDRARREVRVAPTFDEEGREVVPRRTFPYDTLVIAVGSVANDFGTPGVREHAIALDTEEDAARFNRRLINACIRANTQPGPVRPGQLHVAIIGAGATGVELAAELHRTTRLLALHGFAKVALDTLARLITRRTEPHVKLH